MGPPIDKVRQPVGDSDTFLQFYDSDFDRLVRLAYVSTGSAVAAEDLVQDVFVDLWIKWSTIDRPAAYARRAVVNRCTSWVRRRVLERRHAADGELTERVWFDADAVAVADALRHLSTRQRAAVVMRYVDDLAEADIAAALGCRRGTVKSLLARARTILQGALTDDR